MHLQSDNLEELQLSTLTAASAPCSTHGNTALRCWPTRAPLLPSCCTLHANHAPFELHHSTTACGPSFCPCFCPCKHTRRKPRYSHWLGLSLVPSAQCPAGRTCARERWAWPWLMQQRSACAALPARGARSLRRSRRRRRTGRRPPAGTAGSGVASRSRQGPGRVLARENPLAQGAGGGQGGPPWGERGWAMPCRTGPNCPRWLCGLM